MGLTSVLENFNTKTVMGRKLIRGSKRQVFRGTRQKTVGGLTADKLIRNKRGKIVSKAKSEMSKARWEQGVGKWITAVMEARKALGITGFQAIKKGTPLYNAARELYNIKSYSKMRRRSIAMRQENA